MKISERIYNGYPLVVKKEDLEEYLGKDKYTFRVCDYTFGSRILGYRFCWIPSNERE